MSKDNYKTEYEVIADFPGSTFTVGTILRWTGIHWGAGPQQFISNPERYPLIFLARPIQEQMASLLYHPVAMKTPPIAITLPEVAREVTTLMLDGMKPDENGEKLWTPELAVRTFYRWFDAYKEKHPW